MKVDFRGKVLTAQMGDLVKSEIDGAIHHHYVCVTGSRM